MTAMLLMISGLLLDTNFVVSRRREMVNWGEIIPPMHSERQSNLARHNDGNKEKDSLCPIVRAGQRIAQPWRNEYPISLPTSSVAYPSLPPTIRPDCDNDNRPNVFIKILLNRKHKSYMNKIRRSMLPNNNMDYSDGGIKNFPCV
ncbi:hypothetical protein PV326_001410 [Microctonus aethiopoides]|nr:hypothetical protein PV326_001410 [Microctonus aethiopoides]